MKTIRFNIDEELLKKVDAIRGNTSKTVFYTKILNEYISKKPEDNHPNLINGGISGVRIITTGKDTFIIFV